ncbi:hypothetical protein CHUAL_006955 [Chamberlinius hualienensis]
MATSTNYLQNCIKCNCKYKQTTKVNISLIKSALSVTHRQSVVICIIVLIGHVVNAMPSPPLTSIAEETDNKQHEEALERLMKVFGVPSDNLHHPNHVNHNNNHHKHKVHLQTPPQYMLDLYNSIADSSGITKTPNPYNANVIRCLPDRDLFKAMHFQFNLSGVESNEKVLQAEFHVYKTKPSAKALMALRSKQIADDVKSHLLEMRIYQIIDGGRSNRLLDARRVSAYSIGWEVFHVKLAVNDWLKNQSANHGLLVTLRKLNGEPADDNLIKILKRRHHGSKHPILVLFTDDGRPRPPTIYPTEDDLAVQNVATKNEEDYDWENTLNQADENAAILQSNYSAGISVLDTSINRYRRSTLDVQNNNNNEGINSTEETVDENQSSTDCKRHELYVDFEKIGWSSWIISPKGYNAYYCKGSCQFPLGQNQRPTNHATVQSIVHQLNLQEGIGRPCCVPNKLFSINLLYFEGNGNVVLKYYEDMVAASCGCH